MDTDSSRLLALAKTRIYRFEEDLRAHVLVEEIESQFLHNGTIVPAARVLYCEYLAAWRHGERAVGFSEEVATLAGVDVSAELEGRLGSVYSGKTFREPGSVYCVVGSPRSGTSFLLNVLVATGCFAYFTSVSHFRWPLFCLRRAASRSWGQGMPILFHNDTKQIKLRTDLVIPAEGEDVLNRSIRVYDHLQAHTYRLFNPKMMDVEVLLYSVGAHLMHFDVQNFVCKSPFNSFRMHELHRLYPTCKFIHLTRNGYQVARSIGANRFVYVVNGKALGPEEAWALHVEAVLRGGSGYASQMITVKFEELVKEYQPTMRRLLNALGMDCIPPNIDTSRLAAFLHEEAIETRSKLVDELNARLSY